MHCKHFGVCGGCTLPGVPYAEQLARKRQELSRLLGLDVPPLIPSPKESGFRNKVSFVFGNGVMGHYALGSQKVIPIEECPVHHERGNRIAFALRDRLSRVPASILRHVIIGPPKTGVKHRRCWWFGATTNRFRAGEAVLDSADKPSGFSSTSTTDPVRMVGDETIKIEGRSFVKEIIGGVSYLVSPTAFFQTNVGAAGELVKVVLEEVGKPGKVLDLYCGSGLFSLPLVKAGATVTAVEENRQAIVDAEANVRLNHLDAGRIRFLAARVEDALARVARDSWDTVVLDPPRQGCPPEVTAACSRPPPARAVYVSCNPDALAKELPVILKTGYRVTRVQPVDMFPHTDHIETVISFARA